MCVCGLRQHKKRAFLCIGAVFRRFDRFASQLTDTFRHCAFFVTKSTKIVVKIKKKEKKSEQTLKCLSQQILILLTSTATLRSLLQ